MFGRMNRVRMGGLAALIGVAVVAIGCGGDGERQAAVPAGTPRAAVLRLIDDVRAGRYAAACARMDPQDVESQRLALLGQLSIPKGTHAERRRYIEAQRVASIPCVGTVRLMARELGRDLPAIRARAAAARVSPLAPKGVTVPGPALWQLGDQEWVVSPVDGRWIVSGGSLPWSADDDS